MSSVQTRSGATSAGTKVNAGKNAPVKREAAGVVQSDSLAAESYRDDGEFAKNRDAEPGNASPRNNARSDAGASTAGDAPSYVQNQYISDKGGPHGKNLKEGGFDYNDVQDGIQKAFDSEPGSVNDPGRVAESKFEQKEAANPRVTASRDTDLKTGTVYDGLKRDVNV
ncbi:hypothetical protein NOR_03243 [Metarhizium rileyi]|uniref:Uncharacterized protein n=1 Tax=Metarhizium rileyi (strain RCEF 4871) TaxID=1649241 RepID=A0A167FLQ4_METRR|nr:hypothetical protein NOR_03243 [Metarhizium rileyi RCEF 4871]